MLFGKFRILGKLALLILVPLLGVVALSVPIVVNRIDVAREAQDTADVVTLSSQVGSTVQELQEERLLSVGYLFNLVRESELVLQTTKARARLEELAARPGLPAQLRTVLDGAAALNQTRQAVLSRSIRPDQIVTAFSGVITPAIAGIGLSGAADLTTAAGRQVFALEQALVTDDLLSQGASTLVAAVATKSAPLAGQFGATLVQLTVVINGSQRYFTPAQSRLYLGAQQGFASRVGDEFLTQAALDPVRALNLLDIRTLFPSLRSVAVLGGFVQKRIAADVEVAVTANRDRALRDAGLIGGGSLLLLLSVIVLSLFMARAVARPLRRLTASADRIARAAETELQRVADDESETVRPIRLDPVDVAARDEIGDLARAFDRVQNTAARLVERQVAGRRNVAQMFGHVGRRTQNLVGRQLALIDSLERRETDSDRLRELYRLDHMSSRLRRNASSLVVLSGGAGADEHMAPLPLSDVVRLALGEIEDYTRVDVDVPEEILVVPALVADLTLLLAELMENATAFSPPHTRVTVTATELRGGARLAVVDHGLGLSAERMAEENARLTRRERLDLVPSEVLGLFVVGRLARRHGIAVTLTATRDGGVTACVDLDAPHLVPRVEPVAPIQATVPSQHTGEFAPVLGVRSVPGSAQPFDAHVLDRATQTLQSTPSWNGFLPVGSGRPELTAGPVYDAEPVYEAEPVDDGRQPEPYQEPRPAWPPHALGVPVAGHFPYGAAPAPAGPAPLRRRVPGSQLPTGTAAPKPAAPPSADDAVAARQAVEAFEAGVTRAQWDVIEADLAAPPAAGHAPLSRRVPGATLPAGPQPRTTPAPARPAQPLDPDAARALVEQFQNGVALALSETQPQPEGRTR